MRKRDGLRPMTAIGLIIVCLYCSSVFGETLEIALQTHVLGGETELATHYSGSSLLSAASSGSEYAIAYPDYTKHATEQGLFLAVVGPDGKAVCDPIRLSNAEKITQNNYTRYLFSSYGQVDWNGEAFVVWMYENDRLIYYTVSPSGDVLSKIETKADLAIDERFAVISDGDVVRFVKSKSTSASYMELSPDGEIVKDAVRYSFRGEVKQVAFLPGGLAALTRQMYSGLDDTAWLELFDDAGERLGLPVEFPLTSLTPFGSLHWNGSSLVCLIAKDDPEGGVNIYSHQYDRYGNTLREPSTVGHIPSDCYFGKINFDTELIWTGSQYLAVWDQGAPNLQSMENVYARLLDESGAPISDPLLVNPEPLDQVNNGSCFTGDGFAVLTVEKGNHNPSLTFTKIVADVLAPPNTPTPTPAQSVPTPTPKPLFELPDENYLLWEGTLENPFGEFALFIQGSNVEVKVDSFGSASTTSKEFSEPLPETSVDVTGKLIEGNVAIHVLEQPRPWNDYTATVSLTAPITSNGGKQKILFTWVEVEAEPTPTPWPTWNADDPTPTPLQGAPKVLWLVRKELAPNSSTGTGHYSYSIFGGIFESLGAEVDWKVAGEQAVTGELLAPYAAVVFADTRTTPPLKAEEQKSVLDYVRGGGSIFIIGQQDSTALLEASSIYATSVSEPFGIQFSVLSLGNFTIFQDHPIINGVSRLTATGSKLIVEPPAQAIAGYENQDVILAVAEDGFGRVAAFGDEYPFYDSQMVNTNRSGYTNKTFAKNVAAWLLRKENDLDATPTPPQGSHANVLLSLRTAGGITMDVQADKVTLNTTSRDQAEVISRSFNPALPAAAVDVSAVVAQGDASASVKEQPRPWNDYTVTIELTQPSVNVREPAMDQYIVLTWGDEIALDPTPTPFPEWEPNAATPTPYGETPRVLWIVQSGIKPDYDGKYDPGITEFSDTFYALGAKMDVLTAGEQLITDALLNPYQAVIFGDTRDVEPLTGPETESVVNYVRGGGSIFVIGQHDSGSVEDPSAVYASSIVKPFGIEFTKGISGTYKDFARHLLTSQLKSVSGLGGCVLSISPPAQGLGFAESGECIFAAAEDGYGRAVAYTDESSFEGLQYALSTFDLEARSHKQMAKNIAAWLLRMDDQIPALPPEPTPTPTFVPSLSDEEGMALIQRMLEANKPWLNPKAIKAGYDFSLNREVVGSYKFAEGGNTAMRVGSIVQTPLHQMQEGGIGYTVKTLGETTFNGVPVIALDITFDVNFKDRLGFGGQTTTNYSFRGISVGYCRLLVEPEKAVPLFLGASRSPIKEGQTEFATAWTFDPNFFEVDGGYAPISLLSECPDAFNEEQKYQYTDGVWIFKSGRSWYSEDSEMGSGQILSAALINLVVEDANYTKQTEVEDWQKQ